MEPEGSVPLSQTPATWPYPGPEQPIPCLPISKIHINIILPSTLRSSKWLFHSGIPTKTLYTPRLCPASLSYSLIYSSEKFYKKTVNVTVLSD